MVKEKVHVLELKRRINHKPFFTAEGDLYFRATLIFGLPKDKKAKAMKFVINTGQKNKPVPNGEIFEVEVKLKRKEIKNG